MMDLQLTRIAEWPSLRVLAWSGSALYASQGYTLLRQSLSESQHRWSAVGRFRPTWWRSLSAAQRLTYRLCRDGFHALAVLSSGHLVGVIPGAIIQLRPDEQEFHISHRIQRGTRPLNLAVTQNDQVFWGEYLDNRERDEVYIYGSEDQGETWDIVYTFPKGAIRHVHNIVYDEWEECLWILTGDYGEECKMLRAACDWTTVDVVFSGNQQARAVALVPTPEALYFATDTPLEGNYVYRLERTGALRRLTAVNSSSLCGCQVGGSLFFSTAVEPSHVNLDRTVRLYGSSDGDSWRALSAWPKDRWPMRSFQYGNAILPTGHNTTDVLALTTIAVAGSDLHATLWRVDDSSLT